MLKPPKQKQYTYPDVPFPPFETNRSGVVILGSSGNGKSSMLKSRLLGPYMGQTQPRVGLFALCTPRNRQSVGTVAVLRSRANRLGRREINLLRSRPRNAGNTHGSGGDTARSMRCSEIGANASGTQHALYFMTWPALLNCIPTRI